MTRIQRILLGATMSASLSAALPAAGDSSDPGASSAWTSTDPSVRAARELVLGGEFARAEKRLRDGDWSAAAGTRDDLIELISRIRREYGLDEPAILTKLRESIPDVSGDDLARWREAGQLQYRLIDGQVRYFRREPANLFRFCPEARRRRDAAHNVSASQAAADRFVLEKHLAKVIGAAEKTGQSLVLPTRHVARYTITIPPDHPLARPGSLVRCWLPFPQEHGRQTGVKLISMSPTAHQLNPTGTPQRSVYLEQRIGDPAKPVTFVLEFEYVSSAYCPTIDPDLAESLPADYSGESLSERPPHIVFTPELRKLAREIVADEPNPFLRAQRIFAWIDSHIRYRAEEEYSTIPSFTEKALKTRKGDCGIQATLFITLCRAAGIPARWQSGWQTKPSGVNLHDWAEFYVAPWGWLPADPSYGLRDSADERIRWFYLGHQDAYRMIVNLDYGAPLIPAKSSLRSEPADFQRGEVEIDGKNLYFSEWDYEMHFDYAPPAAGLK